MSFDIMMITYSNVCVNRRSRYFVLKFYGWGILAQYIVIVWVLFSVDFSENASVSLSNTKTPLQPFVIAMAILLVVVLHEDGQRELGVFVHRLDVPATIVVAYDFAVAFDHQLADFAAFNSVHRSAVVLLYPIVEDVLTDFNAAFLPHTTTAYHENPALSTIFRIALIARFGLL